MQIWGCESSVFWSKAVTVYRFIFSILIKRMFRLNPSQLQGLVPSNWSNEKIVCLNNLLKSTSHTSSTVNETYITFGVRVFTFSHEVISITVFQHYIHVHDMYNTHHCASCRVYSGLASWVSTGVFSWFWRWRESAVFSSIIVASLASVLESLSVAFSV